VFYAEYKCYGTGANSGQRVKWSKQLSSREVKQFTLKNILQGKDDWRIESANKTGPAN
jgi:pectinesterase